MLSGVMTLLDKLPVPRWLVNIIGLKIFYQVVYIVFTLIIVKKLAIAEYGFYSYIVALIVYFSTIPLLGFPVYLQRNVALKNELSVGYFGVIAALMIASLTLAFLVMPQMQQWQQIAIAIIILANCSITILVAIHDGIGKYSFQYKLFFLTNMWMMICIVQSVFLNHKMTFNLILNYWLINSILVFIFLIFVFMRLIRTTIKLTKTFKDSYSLILADLMLLYAVGIPDSFARFYDKFLGNHFFDHVFLGHYSFNLMVVMAIYALFIRPVNSVLFTQMVRMSHASSDYIKFIKKYYLYGVCIYLICYCIYTPFSEQILDLMGLSKYSGTTGFFKVCFLNAILYLFSVPFMNLIALNKSGGKKFVYCIISLLFFNIPLALLWWKPLQINFFVGFVLAYLMNFLLCVLLEYKAAKTCFESILKDIAYIPQFLRQSVFKRVENNE